MQPTPQQLALAQALRASASPGPWGIDARTGQPAKGPPPGSNVVQPVYGQGPTTQQPMPAGNIGRRNEAIYPTN